MLVEKPTCDQLAFHLAKLLPDLPPLGGVIPPLLKLVRGELPMTEIRCRDPRSTPFCPSTSAGTSMQSAAAVRLVSRTLTRGAPTCLRTASLPRPVRPEPPPDTDGHIVFRQHA